MCENVRKRAKIEDFNGIVLAKPKPKPKASAQKLLGKPYRIYKEYIKKP